MGIIEILLTSLGLAMDAFAVAVCKGLSMKKFNKKKGIIIGLYFGLFQGLMPLIGYLLGTTFQNLITSIDHWIAFVLLGFIGGNMLKEGVSKDCEKSKQGQEIRKARYQIRRRHGNKRAWDARDERIYR